MGRSELEPCCVYGCGAMLIPRTGCSMNDGGNLISSECNLILLLDTYIIVFFVPHQVWSMEKLEHKLIVMREMYDEQQNNPLAECSSADPFYESQENHNLIGVANIFLDCLFHDVRLNYHIPIISQQGEVSGRLQVRQM